MGCLTVVGRRRGGNSNLELYLAHETKQDSSLERAMKDGGSGSVRQPL